MIWNIIVFALALILIAFTLALVLSPKFRADISAGPGKASFLGMSVEGTSIVLLFAITLAALVFIARQANTESSVPPESIKISDLPFDAVSPEDALREIRELWVGSQESVDDRVRALTYEDNESGIIRTFPRERIGPWSLSARAEATHLTVPNNIKPDQAFGCRSRLNKTYEVRLRSEDEDGLSTAKQIVRISNVITWSDDCDDNYDFIQVPCSVAEGLLPEEELSCSPDGVPKWNRPFQRVPIWLTQVVGDD